MWTFLQKLGLGLAALVSGAVLQRTGYVPEAVQNSAGAARHRAADRADPGAVLRSRHPLACPLPDRLRCTRRDPHPAGRRSQADREPHLSENTDSNGTACPIRYEMQCGYKLVASVRGQVASTDVGGQTRPGGNDLWEYGFAR